MATPGPTRGETAGRDRGSTREKILRAAERLFAQDGFDRVTLRQIARAADQRNVAAVQYHFGSKQGLLSAIVEGHRQVIDARRERMLAESERHDLGDDPASLIRILLEPLAEKLDDASGRSYLRIQAQGFGYESMRPATRKVVQRLGRNLGRLERGGSDPVRGRLALLLLFHALADRAHQEETGRARIGDRAAFVETLASALVGLLSGTHQP